MSGGPTTPARPAILVLEDGRSFHGFSYGAEGETFGEAVFCTAMTGYQETLTDPSYHRQVVVMTSPHIGNTGVNDEDPESGRIWVSGYVVRDPARRPSSWRSRRTLDDELREQGVVGISGIDTRALTRHLRDRGAMRVGVSSVERDPEALLGRVLAQPSMAGADLVGEVTTTEAYVVPAQGQRLFTVAAVDLGIKAMTPHRMAERGIEVHVVPATISPEALLALGSDGVFLSNGPGDPATADHAVALARAVLDARVPLFGNQVLGRALGFGTYKLGFGHRGVNQPVLDKATGRVEITAHNHGFAVDAPVEGIAETAYGRVEVSHVCLNDGVVEGLRCLDVPAFSVQYHPEAAAGPHDSAYLFDRFVELMRSASGSAGSASVGSASGSASVGSASVGSVSGLGGGSTRNQSAIADGGRPVPSTLADPPPNPAAPASSRRLVGGDEPGQDEGGPGVFPLSVDGPGRPTSPMADSLRGGDTPGPTGASGLPGPSGLLDGGVA